MQKSLLFTFEKEPAIQEKNFIDLQTLEHIKDLLTELNDLMTSKDVRFLRYLINIARTESIDLLIKKQSCSTIKTINEMVYLSPIKKC